jgi:hypothetical protein
MCESDVEGTIDCSYCDCSYQTTIESWVYQGTTYVPNGQEIESSVLAVMGEPCNTAYVKFTVKGNGTSGKVFYGSTDCTLDSVTTSVIGNEHYASFDITGFRKVYWQVQASFCGDTDTGTCDWKSRGSAIEDCPEPYWWPF